MQRSSREEVLDAVVASVEAIGVRRTTMAEVARRAGMSRSTLYTHFSDVTEATAAALTRELGSLVAEVLAEAGSTRGTGREQLVATATRLAAVIPDQPLIERILELDGELLVPYLVQRLGSSQRAILDTVADLIGAGQRDGSIRDGEPQVLAFSVFLLTQSFVVSARIAESELGRETAHAELAHLLDTCLHPGSAATGKPAT